MLKHSESSAASSEASKLLVATIEKLNAAVKKAFNGNVLFAVVTVDEHHVRSKREAKEVEVVSD